MGPSGRWHWSTLGPSTLLAPWLGRATGTSPDHGGAELEIGIGGRTRLVRLTTLTLGLLPPPGAGESPAYCPVSDSSIHGNLHGQRCLDRSASSTGSLSR